MDSYLIDACDDIAARLRALAVDAEASLMPAVRRELVDIALAVERLMGDETGGGVERAISTERGAAKVG